MEMMMLKWYAAVQFLPAMQARRWVLLILVLLAVAAFGRRVYCRFVCPLGILQSLVRGLRGPRRICSRLDDAVINARGSVRPLQSVVRLAILLTVFLVGALGWGWQWLDPYAIACRAVCWFTSPEFDLAVALFALVPLAIVLVLALVFGGRIWCNWICPVGTLLAGIGSKPWKGDKVKKCAGCDACGRCFK